MPPPPQPMASCRAAREENVHAASASARGLLRDTAECRVARGSYAHPSTSSDVAAAAQCKPAGRQGDIMPSTSFHCRDVVMPWPAQAVQGYDMHVVSYGSASTAPATHMLLVRPLFSGRLQKARAEVSSRQDPCRCQVGADEIRGLGLVIFCSM